MLENPRKFCRAAADTLSRIARHDQHLKKQLDRVRQMPLPHQKILVGGTQTVLAYLELCEYGIKTSLKMYYEDKSQVHFKQWAEKLMLLAKEAKSKVSWYM